MRRLPVGYPSDARLLVPHPKSPSRSAAHTLGSLVPIISDYVARRKGGCLRPPGRRVRLRIESFALRRADQRRFTKRTQGVIEYSQKVTDLDSTEIVLLNLGL